jgi:hypothetical protein
MIGKRAFDYMAQESSSVSDLVVRGRFPPCFMNDSVTLQNLTAKLDTFGAHWTTDNDADGRGGRYINEVAL